jgi:hypothetical protein
MDHPAGKMRSGRRAWHHEALSRDDGIDEIQDEVQLLATVRDEGG